MKAIISIVLSQEEDVGHIVSAYIDIYVNKNVVLATLTREHLAQFELECKDSERLEDCTWVLELAVMMEQGELRWRQGSVVPDTLDVITQQTVFSLCGGLIRHLPVCGWLRVVCGILKRRANSVTKGWNN